MLAGLTLYMPNKLTWLQYLLICFPTLSFPKSSGIPSVSKQIASLSGPRVCWAISGSNFLQSFWEDTTTRQSIRCHIMQHLIMIAPCQGFSYHYEIGTLLNWEKHLDHQKWKELILDRHFRLNSLKWEYKAVTYLLLWLPIIKLMKFAY